jgi:transposase
VGWLISINASRRKASVKNSEEIMEILEAYDLTGSLRGAAELAGCDHKTVAHYVALRDAGVAPDQRTQRPMLIDEFLDKVEEWMDRSEGKIRADVVHDKLVAMGFAGSERTTRRAVAAARRRWWSGHRRVFRPWVPEPGLWLQFDWGDGPRIAGRKTLLFCAWLAWSRFRVVIPTWDRTLPTLLACLDATLRAIGGAPTYALTDNEKTVTVEHVARVPVRHPDVVSAGRYYGMTIRTCVPADPQSKCGEGRPGADRSEPACRVRQLRRTRGRLRRVLRRRERSPAPGNRSRASRAAGRGTGPAARAARAPGDGGVRADPPGRLGRHDQRRRCPVFGAARPRR